jgi:hypothetical protein
MTVQGWGRERRNGSDRFEGLLLAILTVLASLGS